MILEERIDRLARAADAVRSIGLDEAAMGAMSVVERARARSGFLGDAYVLALAGGTGVGKSSILNALAGRTVSAVRAVRPTTDEPIAWVADERRDQLAPLLAWLGIRHVAEHADPSLAGVAILDLPDVDSVRTEHRATVDELLPRIDAVAWVVDPEKYDDARLHAYLRSLRDHAPRMRFILNKLDRVSDADRPALVEDLARRLETAGIADPRIHAVSARALDGIDALRTDLAAEAGAKALVTAKLEADARSSLGRLAERLGVSAGEAHRPLLADARREDAIRASIDGALGVIDPPGVARQVRAAVLFRARRAGGSLLGRAVALLGWMTGQQRRSADPVGYLRDWRRRGSLGRVVNPVHAALVEAASGLPAPVRPAALRTMGAEDLEGSIATTLDRVAQEGAGELRIPASGSILWTVVGALQLALGAVLAFSIAWYATLFIIQGALPVSTVEVPILGPLPLPLALLTASVVLSALLGALVSLHAGWIGRRLGRRLAVRVSMAVDEAIGGAGMAGLRRVEEVRRELAAALSAE